MHTHTHSHARKVALSRMDFLLLALVFRLPTSFYASETSAYAMNEARETSVGYNGYNQLWSITAYLQNCPHHDAS